MPNPSQDPPKPLIRTLWTWMFFTLSKSRERAKIWNLAISKTSEHIQIRNKMPNPIQECLKKSQLGFLGLGCSLSLKNQDREITSKSSNPHEK